jgi:hypothetical protein
VTLRSVRFIDTWAMPYSSMNHPMALTAGSEPGTHSGLPAASRTMAPVRGSGARRIRPFSRRSNAIALARRVDVVLRFRLYAIRKFRAPTAVAPERGRNSAGPKSGFHSGRASRSRNASYSPARTSARLRRRGSVAANS